MCPTFWTFLDVFSDISLRGLAQIEGMRSVGMRNDGVLELEYP